MASTNSPTDEIGGQDLDNARALQRARRQPNVSSPLPDLSRPSGSDPAADANQAGSPPAESGPQTPGSQPESAGPTPDERQRERDLQRDRRTDQAAANEPSAPVAPSVSSNPSAGSTGAGGQANEKKPTGLLGGLTTLLSGKLANSLGLTKEGQLRTFVMKVLPIALPVIGYALLLALVIFLVVIAYEWAQQLNPFQKAVIKITS